MNKKIIATDLDGTLLDENKKISQSTIDYLNNLHEQGNLIIIATGRYYNLALEVLPKDLMVDYIICNAGALTYDVKNNKFIINDLFDHKSIMYLFDTIKKYDYSAINIFTTNNYYKHISDNQIINNGITLFNTPTDFLNDNVQVLHMSARFNNKNHISELCNLISLENYTAYEMIASSKEFSWLEIKKNTIDKYFSILDIANNHNISNDNIITFGDSMNDLDMIKNSGIGVSMKNAEELVISSSKYITEYTNNECGVELWLKKYFDNK